MATTTTSTYTALITSVYSMTPSKAIKLGQLEKQAPTGRDLLVKIKGAATNPVDYMKLNNFGNPEAKVDTPFVIGFDGSGIVEAVGPEVKTFKAGDEVYFSGLFTRNGTFAEYTLVDERIVALKPKSLKWTEAASVPLVALTAWEGLVESLGIPVPNDAAERKANASKTLLVIGGAGGVGSFVIQLAKNVFGLHVITTASRPESVEYAKAQGADIIIDHTKPLLDQLKQKGFQGVDYVFNTAQTETYFAQAIEVVNPLGRVNFINGSKAPQSLDAAFRKRVTVAFGMMFLRPLLSIEPEKQGAALTKIASLLDSGVLHHTVTRTFPFTEQAVAEALDLHIAGKVQGKFAFTISD